MAIDDQAYKDALKAIEAGDIPEDLDLPDPEDYDDMGGIKSLDRDAPSIKMASETGDEEAQMEIGQMLEAFQEAVKQGFKGDIKEFSEYYFGQMKMDKDRQMAMNGGRMKYAMGTPEVSEIEALLKNLKPLKPTKIESTLKNRERSAEQQEMAEAMKSKDKKKYNFMELVDSSNDALDEERLDRKYNAKNYPPSQRGMGMEELKRMLDKAKKDKEKKAKGGIAGVL